MRPHKETNASGDRARVPPVPFTAVGTYDGQHPRTILISLSNEVKRAKWCNFFERLGFCAGVASTPGVLVGFLSTQRTDELRFVLTDSTTCTRMLDTEPVTAFLLATEQEAVHPRLFNFSRAAAVFVESEDGDPINSEVVINPEI